MKEEAGIGMDNKGITSDEMRSPTSGQGEGRK